MGIGLGIARRLHEAGASVLVADLDLAAGEHATAALCACEQTALWPCAATSATPRASMAWWAPLSRVSAGWMSSSTTRGSIRCCR